MPTPRATIPELPEQTVAVDTDLLIVQNGPTTKKMQVGLLNNATVDAIDAHINDVTGAHNATAIAATPNAAPLLGADVQTQLSQAATVIDSINTSLTSHLAAADAHDASMVSVVPVGNLASINVQAALVELQTTIDDLPIESGGGEGITTEGAVDAVAAALVAGNNIDITYDDAMNQITVDVEPLTKVDVGLSNVDNTADFNKPVSAAQQAALDTKTTTPVWTNYTPTLSNWGLGNGTILGRYMRVGNLITFGINIAMGTSTTFVGSPVISLPVTCSTNRASGEWVRCNVQAAFFDANGSAYPGWVHVVGTTATPLVWTPSAGYIANVSLTSAIPFTWVATDEMHIYGSYECV